jgi:hypothetical protein
MPPEVVEGPLSLTKELHGGMAVSELELRERHGPLPRFPAHGVRARLSHQAEARSRLDARRMPLSPDGVGKAELLENLQENPRTPAVRVLESATRAMR